MVKGILIYGDPDTVGEALKTAMDVRFGCLGQRDFADWAFALGVTFP